MKIRIKSIDVNNNLEGLMVFMLAFKLDDLIKTNNIEELTGNTVIMKEISPEMSKWLHLYCEDKYSLNIIILKAEDKIRYDMFHNIAFNDIKMLKLFMKKFL